MQFIEIESRKAGMLKTAIHVPHKLLEIESSLLRSKWPAYRFMGPWEATALYRETYKAQFISTFGMTAEFGAEPGSEGFLTLWRMRQAADRFTMPYDEFLRIAFSMNRNNQKPFIAPHERFSNLEKNSNFTKKVWKNREWLEDMTFTDMGQQYRANKYAGLPSQDQFRSDAVDVARRTKSWRRTVDHHIIRRQCLPDDVLLDDLDNNLKYAFTRELEIGRRNSRVPPTPETTLERYQLWQSCFGVPGAVRAPRSACVSCPAMSTCLDAGAIISRAAALH